MNHQIERSSQDVGARKFAEVLCWIHPCGCPLFLGQGFEGDGFYRFFLPIHHETKSRKTSKTQEGTNSC